MNDDSRLSALLEQQRQLERLVHQAQTTNNYTREELFLWMRQKNIVIDEIKQLNQNREQ